MTVYDFDAQTIDARTMRMDVFRGKTLVIVNVASRCGFTPQYTGLERLHRAFAARGVVVLGFPCNQFGGQEPGSEDEIRAFCRTTYDVTFPLFARIEVNGRRAHPLFQFLKTARRGVMGTSAIKWNFTKFLVAPDGDVVRRYAPWTTADRIAADLERRVGRRPT